MNQLFKKLAICYYFVFVLAILTAVLGYFLNKNGIILQNATAIRVLKFVLVLYMLISIPLALKYFSVKVKKIAQMENKIEKIAKYLTLSKLRIWLISINLLLGILFVYILYQPNNQFDMLYFAAIGAVALLFCRPSKTKIENDLDNQNPQITQINTENL
ncbi:MAG: hypothetical protein LBS50_06190 [Prevotellaceae bacterium]|jgi:hypothetical protein|nr:hypothetical protein [Prevotellaceae bacterium]